MPSFSYKANNSNGNAVAGSIEASDRSQAIRQLRSNGLTPLSIKAIETPKTAGNVLGKWITRLNLRAAKTTTADKKSATGNEKLGLTFIQRLRELHGSGLPVGNAIRTLGQRVTDPKLKQIANAIWRDLSEGLTLAEAMRRQTGCFSQSITPVIAAGEATGNLQPVLQKVATYLEERAAIRQKMFASLAYPAFICTVAIVVVVIFMTVLLPQIQTMLSRLGGEMTLSAKILINGSQWMALYGPVALVLLTICAIAIARWRKTKRGRQLTDRWVLRLPLLGPIVLNGALYQSGSLIGTLLNSGIHTTEALELTEPTINNSDLRSRFHEARILVNEGVGVSQAFRKNAFMPDIPLDILSVGEDTGNLAHGMDEITRGFRDQLNVRISRMITMVSTGALFLAFSLVSLVAMGIVTSIFQVSRSI
jgi:type II secretory pathway component PulF